MRKTKTMQLTKETLRLLQGGETPVSDQVVSSFCSGCRLTPSCRPAEFCLDSTE